MTIEQLAHSIVDQMVIESKIIPQGPMKGTALIEEIKEINKEIESLRDNGSIYDAGKVKDLAIRGMACFLNIAVSMASVENNEI